MPEAIANMLFTLLKIHVFDLPLVTRLILLRFAVATLVAIGRARLPGICFALSTIAEQPVHLIVIIKHPDEFQICLF
jgi:hypothetical protein